MSDEREILTALLRRCAIELECVQLLGRSCLCASSDGEKLVEEVEALLGPIVTWPDVKVASRAAKETKP